MAGFLFLWGVYYIYPSPLPSPPRGEEASLSFFKKTGETLSPISPKRREGVSPNLFYKKTGGALSSLSPWGRG